MSANLFETFGQIDPYVKFTDGHCTSTAGWLRSCSDPADPQEFVITLDGTGRILIYKMDYAGRVISPPAYVEQKTPSRIQVSSLTPLPPDFGVMIHGFV